MAIPTPPSKVSPDKRRTSPAPDIRMIVGLGNPGEAYQKTYHNAGKLAIAYIRAHLPSSWTIYKEEQTPSGKHFSFWTCSRQEHMPPLVFVQPDVFMNESGMAVDEALRYFTCSPDQLMVVHDDSDMNIGTSKFSFDQRSGGHRGIESISTVIGTNAFYRFKIGIRPPDEAHRKKAEAFVLAAISATDRATLEHIDQKLLEMLSR